MRVLHAGAITLLFLLSVSCNSGSSDVIPDGANTAVVQGIVTFAGSGLTISGAEVSIGVASVITGENGSFALTSVSTGARTLTVTRNGYDTYSQSIDVVGPATTHDVELGAAGGSTSLSGLVLDSETATPVSGAKVTLAGLTTFTDVAGSYFFTSTPQGFHELAVSELEYYDFESNLSLTSAPMIFVAEIDWIHYRGNWNLFFDCGGCPVEDLDPLQLTISVAELNGVPSSLAIFDCDETISISIQPGYPQLGEPVLLPGGIPLCGDQVDITATFDRRSLSGTFQLTAGGCYATVSGTVTGTRDHPLALCF